MRSHASMEIAAPSWGHPRTRGAGERGRAEPRRLAYRPQIRRRALELRVGAPRAGAAAVGAALAAGFVLLWVFLLLGVVAPAAGMQ